MLYKNMETGYAARMFTENARLPPTYRAKRAMVERNVLINDREAEAGFSVSPNSDTVKTGNDLTIRFGSDFRRHVRSNEATCARKWGVTDYPLLEVLPIQSCAELHRTRQSDHENAVAFARRPDSLTGTQQRIHLRLAPHQTWSLGQQFLQLRRHEQSVTTGPPRITRCDHLGCIHGKTRRSRRPCICRMEGKLAPLLSRDNPTFNEWVKKKATATSTSCASRCQGKRAIAAGTSLVCRSIWAG